MIRRGSTGTGLTRKPTVSWDSDADKADPEIAGLLECATLNGLIQQIERECFAVMADADLPTWHGSYTFDDAGTLRDDFEGSPRGIRVANELWPLAKARGHEPDSVVGFAARMLSDITWLRENQQHGDHERVALFAYYLGIKRSELWIKQEHERVWRTGKKIHDSAPARRKTSQQDRVRAVDELCAQGMMITKAFATVASKERLTAKAIETDYYKAKKNRS